MFTHMKSDLQTTIDELKARGLYKHERILSSPQNPEITLRDGSKVLNFCANNYLGLSSHPEIIKAAHEAIDRWGFGLSSVRFICGTQDIHKELEVKISQFLGMEDTILFSSAFDANGGVFEPLLGSDSAIISDELNHASIIDGVRLCKAQRLRYKHSDMEELEKCLQEAASAKYKLITTDGVFSMDGDIAKLDEICDLADKYDALVMIDESHATGYIGKTGRGTHEYHDVMDRVDIITTTFGKALGGASGGCVSGRSEIIDMLRQRSRPYLFSNSLAPVIAAATIRAIELLEESTAMRNKVVDNAIFFRHCMKRAGFDLIDGHTAIVPVMIYDEPLALKMADMLLEHGIYVIGFAYPVVPMGKARIRVQLSAAHTREQIGKAIGRFIEVGYDLGLIVNKVHHE